MFDLTLHVVELTDVGAGLPCDLALGWRMHVSNKSQIAAQAL
jgi:hypothetical protein